MTDDVTAHQLRDLPDLVEAVETELVAATPRDGGSRSKPTSKPPMPLAPVDDIELLWSALTTWARDWCEMWDYAPPTPYWPTVCAFLGRHWPRAADEHPAADEFADEVATGYRAIKLHLGTSPRAWQPLPGRWRCPVATDELDGSCGGVLLEHTTERVIRCAGCGGTWEGELEYERLGRMLGMEPLVTTEQAALVAKVSERTIFTWITSGLLPRVPDPQTGRLRVDKRDLAIIAARREGMS